jgi:flagellar assembly protein FliH
MGAVIKDYGSKSESEMKNEDASHSDKTQEDAIGTANHSSDDFIPIETEGLAPMGGLEDAAIQEYQNRKRDLEIEASQEKERGWSEGFQSGYREGEEKAVAEFRAKASELFQNINHLFQDLESLQSHILQQAQDNFYELTQALGEAVIEREIDINPELFKSLIQRAIKESMDSDKFTIKMNSQQISQIKTLDIGEMVNKIVVDESLQKGEFKLESELSTVKSGVKKIIRDLIDNANIDLFSQDEDVAS